MRYARYGNHCCPGEKIEHVGSTPVPGAVSKGDLDICVSVPALDFKETLGETAGTGLCGQSRYTAHSTTLHA